MNCTLWLKYLILRSQTLTCGFPKTDLSTNYSPLITLLGIFTTLSASHSAFSIFLFYLTTYPPVFLLPLRSINSFFKSIRICLSIVLKGISSKSDNSFALIPCLFFIVLKTRICFSFNSPFNSSFIPSSSCKVFLFNGIKYHLQVLFTIFLKTLKTPKTPKFDKFTK